MKVVSFLLLLFTAAAKGDNCYAGSSYDNINDATEASIDKRYWYLNLDEPFTCSGELKKYEVFYYELDEADYRVQAAIWKPRENEEGVFDLVSSSKKQIRKDNDKRRKRASTDGSDSKGVSNVYTRKGSIIGVYFKSGDTPMPIIGTKSGYSVCKYQDTSYTKTVVNCTSNSSLQQNTLIHATAAINKLECASSEIVTIQDGNYENIDGDTEYGARVRYYCNEGYQIVYGNGDGMVICDENEEWVGTVPSCEIVTCNDINTIPNGVVNGNTFTYQSLITFTCITGYELHGSSSITCLSNSTWSDTIPTCDIIASAITTASIASSSQTVLPSTTQGASTNMIKSTTTLLPGRSSEVQDNSSFPVVSVAAPTLVAVIIVLLVTIILILLLLVVRNSRRKSKAQINIPNPDHLGSMNSEALSDRNYSYATQLPVQDNIHGIPSPDQQLEYANCVLISTSDVPTTPNPCYASVNVNTNEDYVSTTTVPDAEYESVGEVQIVDRSVLDRHHVNADGDELSYEEMDAAS